MAGSTDGNWDPQVSKQTVETEARYRETQKPNRRQACQYLQFKRLASPKLKETKRDTSAILGLGIDLKGFPAERPTPWASWLFTLLVTL